MLKKLGRTFLLIFLLILLIDPAYGQAQVSILGSVGTPAKAIAAVDSDKDGRVDTAILGTDSGTKSSSGSYEVDAKNVRVIVPADIDSTGYLDGAVAVGSDIVGLTSVGRKWTLIDARGYSAAAVDLNEDGLLNEVVVGGADKVYAINATNGAIIWTYALETTGFVSHIAVTRSRIISGVGNLLTFLTFEGNYAGGKAFADQQGILIGIEGISGIDMDGTGDMNGVVVVLRNGNITGFDMFGQAKWSTAQSHEGKNRVRMFPIDRNSKGMRDHVVFNLDFAIYWINSKGTIFRAEPAAATALSPIDYDGDGILDDVVVGKDDAGKIYAYNALGVLLELVSKNIGAALLTAIDFDRDGRVDDAIGYSDVSKSMISFITQYSDYTNATVPITTTPPPTTTTPPPTTTPPLQEISVDAGLNQTAKEGEEVVLTAKATPSTVGGEITSYLWTEGDAILGREKSIVKKFTAGEHEITVEITDDQGKTATDTVIITAEPLQVQALTVDAGPDLTIVEGTSLTLTARATPSAPEAAIIAYIWSEDGIVLGSSQSISVTLTEGTHQITVTATESTGQTASDTLVVKVLPAPRKIPSFDISSILRYWPVVIYLALAGVGIVILLYIREKVLDFLWERRKDFGE